MDKSKNGVRNVFRKIITNETLGALFLWILLCILLTCMNPTFLSARKLLNLFRSGSFYVILAMGILITMVGGVFDMSVGSIMGFAGIVAALMAQKNMNVFLIIIVVIAIGIVCGALNGALTAYLGITPFIATMGTQLIWRGFTVLTTGGYPVNGLSESFCWMGTSSILGIPTPIYIMVILAVITWYIMTRTKLGRHIYATGGNIQAAITCGINTRRIQLITYVYSGIMAAVAGMLMTARLSSGQVSTGTGVEMDAIAGAVIGGSSMAGGVGSVMGTFFGTIVIATLKNGMTLVSLDQYWQKVAQGVVIVLAVLLDIARRKLRK